MVVTVMMMMMMVMTTMMMNCDSCCLIVPLTIPLTWSASKKPNKSTHKKGKIT